MNRELAAIAEARGLRLRARQPARHVTRSRPGRDVSGARAGADGAGARKHRGRAGARSSSAELDELAQSVGADALCVHLNPAMEVVQPEGDRDFRGIEPTFARLVTELKVPVVAKETGCGIARGVAERLSACGVRHVDVSGAGGTSWVARRDLARERKSARARRAVLGLGHSHRRQPALGGRGGFATVIATGGIATGLDVARALALGADAVGIARPVLQAFAARGRQGALDFLSGVEQELRTALLLMGAANVDAAQRAPRLIVGELASWQQMLSPAPAFK